MIGGTAPGAGNLISGASNNGGSGVQILASGNTHVVGNLIGTAADGITPLPNQFDGVAIYDGSSQNTVGGQLSGSGNTIAFNGRNGVHHRQRRPPVRGNTIRGNSIYANTAAGIAFVLDGNDNLAPPTIDGIDPLHGTACAQCAVEIFSDSEDEGRIFEGAVFTNDGTWTFDGALSGPHVTATNTDISNNTSPFSVPFSLASPTPTPSFTPPRSPSRRHADRDADPHSDRDADRNTGRLDHRARYRYLPAAPPPPPPRHRPPRVRAPTPSRSATATTSATALLTASRTAISTAAAPTATHTPAPDATATPTPALTASAAATATVVPCAGDCDGNHVVSIDELIAGVGIALGNQPPSTCPAMQDSAGQIDIAQLIKAVHNALVGCGDAA